MMALTTEEELLAARLRDGSRLWTPVNDPLGRTVYWCGDHDPKITWVCRRVLRPGDTCVDIGANVGAVALRAARLVGPGGTVHAIEPQPELADLLTRSAAANGFSHLRVHAVALSDHDGDGPLYLPVPANRGAATMDPTLRTNQHAITVPVRHAGRFLESVCPGRVRLLKIDVENHEETVLRAAEPWLARRPPDVILFESYFDRSQPFWSRPTVALVARNKYTMFQVPRALLRMRLDRLEGGREPSGPGWDFAAIHADAVDAFSGLGIGRHAMC